MYRLPAASATALVTKVLNAALTAAPPSPLKPTDPVPASVVITPPDTLRIRFVSVMNRSPELFTATEKGPPIQALVAAPPSPVVQQMLLPATVVMTPAGVTLRIR